MLKKDVRHKFKEILDVAKNRPGGEFLIGEDLTKKLEDVRQAQKTVDTLQPTVLGTQARERRCKQPFLPSRTGPHGHQGPPLCGGRSPQFTGRGPTAHGRLQNRGRAQGFQPRGARTVTVEFRAETVEFRAGGTAACVGAWREITSDPFVMEGVTGTRVDVNTLLVQPDLPRS